MTDISKLSALLDDPDVHELIFGLAHDGSAAPSAQSGAPRLRAIVLQLVHTTSPEQYSSWLSDDAPNKVMAIDQVRAAIGDAGINDLALYVKDSPNAVAWLLAAVLPELVDAVSPGGEVIDAVHLAQQIIKVNADHDRSGRPSASTSNDALLDCLRSPEELACGGPQLDQPSLH